MLPVIRTLAFVPVTSWSARIFAGLACLSVLCTTASAHASAREPSAVTLQSRPAMLAMDPLAPIELPTGSRVMRLPAMRSNGVPVTVQLVRSPVAPPRFIEWVHQRLAPGLTVTRREHALLASNGKDRLWLLTASPDSPSSAGYTRESDTGTVAVFSASLHGPGQRQAPRASTAPLPSWFGTDLILHMDVSVDDTGGPGRFMIYSHPSWPEQVLYRRVAAALSRSGWASDAGAQPALTFWRQGDGHLMTSVVAREPGSAVLIAYQEHGSEPARTPRSKSRRGSR